MRPSRWGALAAMLLILLVTAACDWGWIPPPTPTPTLTSATQTAHARPPLLVQFCNDDTGSFPRDDFKQANQLIATLLQLAVTPNQQGVTLYATAITHNTFAPENTLQPPFQVPAIPAYPTPPTPIPTPEPENPVSDAPKARAVVTQSIANIVQYNQTVAAIKNQIKDAQTQLASDAGKLTSWNPPVDYDATSILGCFALAGVRFQGQADKKVIYIASDLQNNTNVDYTQDFVTAHKLAGVVVHVIFFPAEDAGTYATEEHAWCTYLESAGASAVLFNDPASSSTWLKSPVDLIDQDAATPAQPCPS